MAEKKVIAVIGATGAQGGSLAQAILNDPSAGFHVRAITRKPDSEKGQALSAAGAEVVSADLDDPATVRRAFEGAYGAYCVTNFWEHFSPARELEQARAQAEAAKAAGVQHVIWSTLEDTRQHVPLEDDRMPTLQEKYKVPHFDAKGEADRFFEASGVPTTYLLTSLYWDNFIHFGMGPKKNDDGSFTLALPMGRSRLAGIAADDIGKCAFGIFREESKLQGRRIGIAGEHLTGEEMAKTFSSVLGQEVKYQDVPLDAYRNLGFPGAEDLGNMFQLYQEFQEHFGSTRNTEAARRLNPELQTFEQWLRANKEKFQAV